MDGRRWRAGLPEHSSAAGVGILVKLDPRRHPDEQPRQSGPCVSRVQRPEILAV